jgi:putative chitinase
MAFINTLFNLWPEGDKFIPGLRDGIAKAAPAVFPKYGIDSKLVIVHLMAQISLECGAGTEVVENLNYSPARLIEVWPRHFNQSNAFIYAHNPQKLANYIYNPPLHNDLGNFAKSNDGWNFRGRGATQTTGRDGYRKLGEKTGLDLLDKPDLLNDPNHFLECGVADFILCGCLPWAVKDDVVQVTKHLNGGTVGLSDRIEWLHRWKEALGK